MINQSKRCNVIDFSFNFNVGFNCLMKKIEKVPQGLSRVIDENMFRHTTLDKIL